jgi:dipeptide/tripeptide permease
METQAVHRLLSALILMTGVLLMAYMISVESEPGAIPLFLIVLGTGWYATARFQHRSHRQ